MRIPQMKRAPASAEALLSCREDLLFRGRNRGGQRVVPNLRRRVEPAGRPDDLAVLTDDEDRTREVLAASLRAVERSDAAGRVTRESELEGAVLRPAGVRGRAVA